MSIRNHGMAINRAVCYQIALNRAIAEYLVTERKTQGDLAELLGLGQSSVSRRLSGSSPWTLDDVALLVDAGILTVSILEFAE